MGSSNVAVQDREQAALAIEVRPDWVTIGTAVQLEEHIGGGFKFTGPGWYISKDGAALIVPADPFTDPWQQKRPVNTVFRYFSYGQNPFESFNAVVNAPTRVDDR